jgi:DNA-binding transcriptional MerR regulator
VSGRTYLSIGDVLTLLREEFPDVTISKIRFLESQGLVNPERSPSGYRKFFDHDVERLRWVLRQQREHFLPLKVIRDRLADGDLDDTADRGNGKQSEPAHAASASSATADGAGGHARGDTGDAVTQADTEAMARILADASRRAASMPVPAESAASRRGNHMGGVAAEASDEPPTDPGPGSGSAQGATAADRSSRTPASSSPRHAAGSATGGGRGGRGASGGGGGTGAGAAPSRGSGSESAAAEPVAASGRKGQGSGSTRGAAGAAGGTAASSIVTGASMTADELCSASGLAPEELAALESFGLIQCVPVAGILTYDEDALTVANLASSFRAFGIEARHLRLYRNAADREMGLIEQVVIPLLRQRNPESRQRAVESADQLATLGQTMRATLLRLALRRHLGG